MSNKVFLTVDSLLMVSKSFKEFYVDQFLHVFFFNVIIIIYCLFKFTEKKMQMFLNSVVEWFEIQQFDSSDSMSTC